ncbi:MAG: metallophosphoesterase [Candidatus Thorarchaeota archaeon]
MRKSGACIGIGLAICLISLGMFLLFWPNINEKDYMIPEAIVQGGFISERNSNVIKVHALGYSVNISLKNPNLDNSIEINLVLENFKGNDAAIDGLDAADNLVSRDALEIILSIQLAPNASKFLRINHPTYPKSFNFVVMGDNRGRNDILAHIFEEINTTSAEFVLHGGDLTRDGTAEEFQELVPILEKLSIPLFVTPGNHDIRSGGTQAYEKLFGPTNYTFDFGHCHFVMLDTSKETLTEEQLDWLNNDLDLSDKPLKFVFTHTPPFDLNQENQGFVDKAKAKQFQEIVELNNVTAVFLSHFHLFHQSQLAGVNYVISGGAGAPLRALPEDGGYYHYVLIEINETGFYAKPVAISLEATIPKLTLVGHSTELILDMSDLLALPATNGTSTFQNNYENWRGYGTYQGVRLSTLIELIGGMTPDETLRLTAIDGYTQEFGYDNVYPNSTWFAYQGHLILAYMFNGTLVPEWHAGYRAVFLPEDNAYSNADCAATSYPGQGCSVYESAGARCVMNVLEVRILSNN